MEEVCDDIFQAVSESYRGKEWPDVAIFAKCAEERGAQVARAAPVVQVFNTVDINLRRLQRGDALGDEWVYGRRAVELLEAGATEEQLDAYRSGLFFDMRDVWGEERALEVEKELRARHDNALEDSGKRKRYATFIQVPGSAAE